MRVTPSSRLHALPFVNVQRVETCIGHAHKRLKRDPETIYIKATVATRQPQTDGSSDAGGETHTAAGVKCRRAPSYICCSEQISYLTTELIVRRDQSRDS